MSGRDENRRYGPYKIPERLQRREGDVAAPVKPVETISFSDGPYYEIEYGGGPIPGVGKFVLKGQEIKKPEKDEIRDLFVQMRDIARAHRSIYDFSKLFERQILNDNANIFYKQGIFMKDFTDNYAESVPFSQPFPAYQMMGYQQLRTYFTWRTQVREGNIAATSLSYACVYMYELINNIGVGSPQEGLEKLFSFWQAYRIHDPAVDKLVPRWLRDYHIYYPLAQRFEEFVQQHDLAKYYVEMTERTEPFDVYCAISKYNIRKSAFFAGNEQRIRECFDIVLCKLKQAFIDNGRHLEEFLFQPTQKTLSWMPFRDAVFYQQRKQPDSCVLFSPAEMYLCIQNKWLFCKPGTPPDGKQLIGFVMRQMEAALRKLTGYKGKFAADISAVPPEIIAVLKGLSLENIVNSAVLSFYREATKTVVKVDKEALAVIRQEALSTQEKLIVQEEGEPVVIPAPPPPPVVAPQPIDGWGSLKNTLSLTEMEALAVLFEGSSGIKQFADACGIMLEVLIDGINEKAMDCVGDNLIDEDFGLYDDYSEHVKDLIG